MSNFDENMLSLLATTEDADFQRRFSERTNGSEVGPDLAEQVSLLPITKSEAASLRSQIALLHKNSLQAHAVATQSNVSASQAMDLATIAKSMAEATRSFSGRLLELEFKITRILEALSYHDIEVDLAARTVSTESAVPKEGA
jgi:hypothetical protein